MPAPPPDLAATAAMPALPPAPTAAPQPSVRPPDAESTVQLSAPAVEALTAPGAGAAATAAPEVAEATEALLKPNFWGDEQGRQPFVPAYTPPPVIEEVEEDDPHAGLQLDRASAGAVLGSAFFAFPALAVLITGLALGYKVGAVLGVFVLVAVPLGALGSLIVGMTTWRTLHKWPVEPAPPSAGMSTLPPIKLHSGLSVILAGLLVTALLLAPPSGSGGAAGALAGVAGSLALAAYFGALPLRSYERKRWTVLWVDRRSKGLRTFFTTPVPAPSHSASALRFDEQEAQSTPAQSDLATQDAGPNAGSDS